MLIYLNASLVGPLLSPHLDAQDGLTGQPYAAQDIGMSISLNAYAPLSLLNTLTGFAYPNATKTEADQTLGIERGCS